MPLRDIPRHFVCAHCMERQHLEVMCRHASTIELQRCVRCCGCMDHQLEVCHKFHTLK